MNSPTKPKTSSTCRVIKSVLGATSVVILGRRTGRLSSVIYRSTADINHVGPIKAEPDQLTGTAAAESDASRRL